jgi:hypothetical protein
MTDNLSKTLTVSIQTYLDVEVKKYVKVFIQEAAKLMKENCDKKGSEKITSTTLMNLWENINESYTLKKKDPVADGRPVCQYVSGKGVECKALVCKNSATGNFCSKHYKTAEKKKNVDENGNKLSCQFKLKTGKNIGQPCSKSVCKKSDKYCSKHYEKGMKEDVEAEKEKKVAKKKVVEAVEDEGTEAEAVEDEGTEAEEKVVEKPKKVAKKAEKVDDSKPKIFHEGDIYFTRINEVDYLVDVASKKITGRKDGVKMSQSDANNVMKFVEMKKGPSAPPSPKLKKI